MTRRPMDIGTAAESAVVKVLREHGFPHAERRALHGSIDLGDITGTPGLAWEVKGGTTAKTAPEPIVQTVEVKVPVAIACALVGVIIGIINLTGVAAEMGGHIIALGEKSLMLAPT